MTAAATLEQEFEALLSTEDYRVIVHASDNYLKLRIVYLPKLNVRGEGAFSYIANGLVGEWHTFGKGRRKWRKARKWAQEEIAGHREFVRAVNQA